MLTWVRIKLRATSYGSAAGLANLCRIIMVILPVGRARAAAYCAFVDDSPECFGSAASRFEDLHAEQTRSVSAVSVFTQKLHSYIESARMQRRSVWGVPENEWSGYFDVV